MLTKTLERKFGHNVPKLEIKTYGRREEENTVFRRMYIQKKKSSEV